MAGISDSPARRIAREFGADFVVAGLISSEGLLRNSTRTRQLAAFDSSERPIGLQIFGAKPDSMAKAAQMLAENNPDFIDINFGCPVRKIVEKNGGSSVLKDLSVMESIVGAVVKAVHLPVTVKMRTGWDSESLVYLDAGKVAENGGASAITLHPRTRAQGFSGKADWASIARLKQTVAIPVIGNGDISCPQDVECMFDETGCDAVMIGRASLGNPWIFKRTRHFLSAGELLPEPSAGERIEAAIRHFGMMIDYYGPVVSVYRMRTQLSWYLKGLPNSTAVRARINQMVTPQEVRDTLLKYRDNLAENSSVADSVIPNYIGL